MMIDLNSLDLSQLKRLQKDVEKAVNEYQERQFNEARQKLEAEARAMGFSLSELAEGKKKATGTKSPAKYRNADDPTQTWTGRGRKPGWIVAHLSAGRDMAELEIS